jgi:ATP-dependent DNA ligase
VAALPEWIRPQLTQLVDQAPDGPDWLHEIKFDGYRMHARLDHGTVRLLTRTGLDWTHKYPAIADAVASIGATHVLSRRRALRRAPRRRHLVQHDPGGLGQR